MDARALQRKVIHRQLESLFVTKKRYNIYFFRENYKYLFFKYDISKNAQCQIKI